VWRFDDDGQILRCVDSYDRESKGHTRGTVLDRADFPQLFDLLQKGEDISARDAGMDTRLAEVHRIYLQPLGCESLLSVPIGYHGRTAGSLWFEHERLTRSWSTEEISFAHAIASMLALRFSSDRKSTPAPQQQIEDHDRAEDSTVPPTGVIAPGSDSRPELRAHKADRADRQTKPVSANGTNRFTSFLDRLAAGGIDPAQTAADIFTDTTVMALRFTDPLSLAGRVADSDSMTTVDHMVGYLEEMAASQGIEYMKVMGDQIVCAAGIDSGSKDHARLIADLALNLQNRCTAIFTALNTTMEFRIGIDTGAVMGSPVGREHKAYNIWGESVRFASKMADAGIAGGIQASETTYRRLRANYLFQVRGSYYLPNIGETSTYLLTGRI
jgi:class 3 adenylate cyclase